MSLLTIEGLRLSLPGPDGPVLILDGVDLEVGRGEAVGLVGESGSGKSMTAKSVLRTLPARAEVEGTISFDGTDVGALDKGGLRRYRNQDVSLIFQDARACINPVRTIGDFLTEALRTNQKVPAAEARRRAVKLLAEMHITHPEQRLKQYPHQLSGGLLQRVQIAAALATEPRLIIADEPTTALDVTTQAEVMAILDEQRRERGLALLFITHDLDLAAAVCDHVGVMYAGKLVETQPTTDLLDAPRHPYTRALLDARPSIDATEQRPDAIPGRPVSCFEAPDGCSFAPRCSFSEDRCTAAEPALRPAGQGVCRCVRTDEIATALAQPHALTVQEGA